MLQIIKRLSLAVPTLVLASATVVTVPAFAQGGSNDSSATASTGSGSSETETEHATKVEKETELHHRGAAIVAELKQKHTSTDSTEKKTKSCEARKHGLQTKFSHISANSVRLETKIGTFQTRASDYKTAHNVTVDGWDTLVTAADEAKTKADASIAAMKAVTPAVDCTSSTVAEDVATFKAAAQQVRTDLKAYKTAVKNLFVALQNAKGDDTSTSTTEGSDQ